MWTVTRRKHGFRALELLRNVDNTLSVVFDNDQNDFGKNYDLFWNYFEDEIKTTYQPNTNCDSDEDSDIA